MKKEEGTIKNGIFKRQWFWVIIAFVVILILFSQPGESTTISAIKIRNETLNVNINSSVTQYFVVTATEEFSYNDLKFISENPNIATVEFKEISLTSYVYFTVTGISTGTTQIYFTNADKSVISDKITVSVKGDHPVSTNASASNSTPATTDTATESNVNTENSQTGTSTQSSTSTNENFSTPDQNKSEGVMVWLPKNGEKYHKNPSCSNMKNPKQATEEEAIKKGYKPCSKCCQ